MTDTMTDDEGFLVADKDAIHFLDAFTIEGVSSYEDGEPDQTSLAMFEGDTSELFPEQRHCLHALVKQRYISADRHPEHWAVLLSNQGVIKSRLNDLFLGAPRRSRLPGCVQAASQHGDR